MLKRIYKSKWFPRFFFSKSDGGVESGVTAYCFFEWKIFFSIGILHFNPGSREDFHNHAFNAITFWISGSVVEEKFKNPISKVFSAGFRPKYTPRSNFHRIIAQNNGAYALTIRGPWLDYWYEVKNNDIRILTHGRRILNKFNALT
jgi:hypothetical protein